MLHASLLLFFELASPEMGIFKVADFGAQDHLQISTLSLPRCVVLSTLLCICELLFISKNGILILIKQSFGEC